MGSRIKPRFTYANVVSTLCLFVVLGGGAYAHHRNSVGPQQIRGDAVKKRHVDRNAIGARELRRQAVRPGTIAPNAVRSRHILDGAVSTDKLADGVAVSGSPGPQGEQGPPGPATGPAGGDLAGTYPNPLIANGAVTNAKLGSHAVTGSKVAPDALGGRHINEASLDYGAAGCKPGLVHSHARIRGNADAFPSAFTTDLAFRDTVRNCSGGTVEVRKEAVGHYFIRFNGDPSLIAISSVETGGRYAGAIRAQGGPGHFSVTVRSTGTGELVDGVVNVVTF